MEIETERREGKKGSSGIDRERETRWRDTNKGTGREGEKEEKRREGWIERHRGRWRDGGGLAGSGERRSAGQSGAAETGWRSAGAWPWRELGPTPDFSNFHHCQAFCTRRPHE